jgi:hypothetical protein
MPLISTNPYYTETNVDPQTRCWIQDIDGVDRRQSCRAAAGRVVAGVANHLFARQPRVRFTQFIPNGDIWNDANSRDPALVWCQDDLTKMGRTAIVSVLTVPREQSNSAAANAYLQWQSNALENTGLYQLNTAATNYWADLQEHQFRISRGDEANAVVEEGVSIFGGYRIVDVIVEEEPQESLDTDIHLYCDATLMTTGREVLADFAEQARARIHDYRSTTLPVALSWSGQKNATDGWSTPGSPGTQEAMAVVNTADGDSVYVNLLDHSNTKWDPQSPGVTIHCEQAGVGPDDEATGSEVHVTIRALAATSSGATNAKIRCESPYSNAEVTVTNVTPNPEWITFDSTLVVNSLVDDQAEDSTRNKVDIFGQVDSGSLWVYAVAGWITYV